MLLCYVDESNRDPFFGFGCLIAGDVATKNITASLNRVMLQASVDYGIARTTEFHAHEMFHGKGVWEVVGARARVGLFFKVIEAILTEDVRLLLRSVDADRLSDRQSKQNYPVNFPAEQVCFQHILQRIDKEAIRQGTYALVIADNRSDRERHRERFATYQTTGTPGVYMHTTLGRLLDTVHFAPSHQSRMLQAVDVLAFVFRRRMTVTESDPRAAKAMEKLWGLIVGSGKLLDLGSWP